MTHTPSPMRRNAVAVDGPGTFQCVMLRAFELRKSYRDVFVLKEIQGYSLEEIAAILGISIDTAQARLQRAQREIGSWNGSEAMERAR